MYNPKDIIEVLADNIRKTRNPFGAGNSTMNRWWKKTPLRTELHKEDHPADRTL